MLGQIVSCEISRAEFASQSRTPSSALDRLSPFVYYVLCKGSGLNARCVVWTVGGGESTMNTEDICIVFPQLRGRQAREVAGAYCMPAWSFAVRQKKTT